MGGKDRKTGIDIIGDVPWGTHFCQFYQTNEDLIDILAPYFKTGLENNEFCMWVTSERFTVQEVKKAMRKDVPNFDQYLKKGQIEIVPHTEWYLKDGVFNLKRVLNAWVDKLNQAVAKGYDGIRVTGNTAWLEKRDWKNFVDYEKTVNDVIAKYQMMAVCAYPLDKCGASEVIDIVNNHQFALIKRGGAWKFIKSLESKKTEEQIKEYSEDLEEKVEERTQELKRTNEVKAQFIADASHELRTPLTIIKTNIDLVVLRKNMKRAVDPYKIFFSIDEEVRRMVNILSDLVLLVQADAGKYWQLQYTRVRLDQLVLKVARKIQILGKNKNISIKIRRLDNVHICGDESMLEKLLMNLLFNAIIYGKINGWVQLALKKNAQGARLIIADNGIGIPKQDLPRIFRRFYRVDKACSRQSGGTGLGLSICKWIVEAHGGNIGAHSLYGQGSTFVLQLPISETRGGGVRGEKIKKRITHLTRIICKKPARTGFLIT